MEYRNTPERRIFGEYPEVTMPVNAYVMLPQVRSGLNPEIKELKESIDTKGLLNPIDVAVMSEPQLKDYIEFVNEIWGTEASLADYHRQNLEGVYYVVIAGHSRTEAVRQLQSDDNTNAHYYLRAKLHDVSEPQEIIALQIDENIHSKPAQERRAMAIVEAYEYGRRRGEWDTKREFLEVSGGRFSAHVLNEALGFVALPPAARDFIFSGKLSYAVGVAIGKEAETIREYTKINMGITDENESENFSLIDEGYRDNISLMIAGIDKRGLNSTAGKKFVTGRVNVMKRRIASENEAMSEGIPYEMISVSTQADQYLRALQRELKTALREIALEPHAKVLETLRLHERLTGHAADEAVELVTQSLESGKRELGRLALRRR